jgi:hypothetical protein
MEPLSGGTELLFTLVLKVGWAAALAALLVRFRPFRTLLFTEVRDSDQKVKLLLFLVPPLAIGVMLRIFGGYRFFDLMLEGSFLMGLIGGQVVGLLGGSLISLPAFGNRSDTRKRRRLALWAFSVFEYSAMALEACARSKRKLGHAAALYLRGVRGCLD